MPGSLARNVVAAAGAALAWMAAALLAGVPAAAADTLAITNARIVPSPSADVLPAGTILVRDGRVVAVGTAAEVPVPAGAERIDASSLTVVPGFWNSHVHLISGTLLDPARHGAAELESALREMLLRWGVTTAFEVAGLPGRTLALGRRIEAGELDGPRLLTVDAPFYPEGGTPVYVRELYRSHAIESAEVAGPGAAAARAQRQLAAGAHGVKLFTGAIVGGAAGVIIMDVDVVRATVAQAHAAGKRAFAHPTNMAGLAAALDGGVDVLVHTTPAAGPWPVGTAERMAAAEMALVPTLKLFDDGIRADGADEDTIARFRSAALQQLEAFRRAGGTVLFGTDVGFIADADPTREYQLMAEAGMDWRAILDAMTRAPADFFGAGARSGRIAPGSDADLVLLARSPERDVAAFADVVMTIRGGRVVYRRTPPPPGEGD